jgi:hypothetical protein
MVLSVVGHWRVKLIELFDVAQRRQEAHGLKRRMTAR